MGFFDNREKELENQIEDSKQKIKKLEGIINQYKSENHNLDAKISELKKIQNNQENEKKKSHEKHRNYRK